MSEPLLIVGGSVRAAAMSARRAGFEPLAIDRFADADLRQVCRTHRHVDKLAELPKIARQMPAADWMYTGPLENEPSLIDQIAAQRRLLGNDRAILKRVRNPQCLHDALHKNGFRVPQIKRAGERPNDEGWLMKPLRSAGGFGVKRIRSGTTFDVKQANSVYFQEFINGRSIGATFVGANGRATLVGSTEQLLGPTWGGCREFQYVGSIGPIFLLPDENRALELIGASIARTFSLRGLFGIDSIVNAAGVWPIEVNPRYTASIEILERALDITLLRWHVDACRHDTLPVVSSRNETSRSCESHGKAVVYARGEFRVDERLERTLHERSSDDSKPMVADIPIAGTKIEAGAPITTVFTTGETDRDVRERLRAAVAEVLQLFNRDVPTKPGLIV